MTRTTAWLIHQGVHPDLAPYIGPSIRDAFAECEPAGLEAVHARASSLVADYIQELQLRLGPSAYARLDRSLTALISIWKAPNGPATHP